MDQCSRVRSQHGRAERCFLRIPTHMSPSAQRPALASESRCCGQRVIKRVSDVHKAPRLELAHNLVSGVDLRRPRNVLRTEQVAEQVRVVAPALLTEWAVTPGGFVTMSSASHPDNGVQEIEVVGSPILPGGEFLGTATRLLRRPTLSISISTTSPGSSHTGGSCLAPIL